MFPSSITDQLLTIVDSYNFSDDSLKIQALIKLEQAFMDYLLTDILLEIPEQKEQLAALCNPDQVPEFLALCQKSIPHRDRFVEESLEDFKSSMSLS